MNYFSYDQEQVEWLTRRDPVLGKAMQAIGPIRRLIYPDSFKALLRAIIGQQISQKAQDAIWSRFLDLFEPVTPAKIAAEPEESLKQCGTSLRKASYLKGIARAWANGSLDHERLSKMNDQKLSDTLIALPGVGQWTCEMLLIFTFQRPDILSYGDLAIKRGMRNLYGYKEITKKVFEEKRKLYSPFATLAGMYLWELA